MNDVIQSTIAPLIGLPCTRKSIGRMKSLSLGFGDIQKDDDQQGIPYRAWEIGTYYGAWRIIQEGKIVCGSQDPQSIEELNISIDKIAFGNFAAMRCLSTFDFRIELDNNLLVDF